MIYARRKDANHSEIVDTLRADGIPLIETYRLFEIKDGSLPPSSRELTPKEAKTFHKLNTVDEIL